MNTGDKNQVAPVPTRRMGRQFNSRDPSDLWSRNNRFAYGADLHHQQRGVYRPPDRALSHSVSYASLMCEFSTSGCMCVSSTWNWSPQRPSTGMVRNSLAGVSR